jgi:aspartyl-tRNA(Asn)/glutamyl-tRNA(Gln) amidotransferase subunit A
MMNRELTLAKLYQGLRKKTFSSVEITEEYLAAIKKDDLNAFIRVNDAALDQAKTADRTIASGKSTELTGIPVAVKDVLTTEGVITTAGSKTLAKYQSSYTTTAVQRLQDVGMIILGKTNCDEFALGSSNENSAFGPVKNPHDKSRVSGGSSGGSAVAVAANLAPVALGTDTGGSVRQPAAFCGLVGLKPTYGRVSRYGLIAAASSLDQVGVLSRNARDSALILQAMAGYDPHDATSSTDEVMNYVAAVEKPVTDLTIGLPKEYYAKFTDPAMEKIINIKLTEFRGLPHLKFKEVSLRHTNEALAVYYIIMSSEVSANLARFDGLRYGLNRPAKGSLTQAYAHNRSAGFGDEVRRRIMLGTYSLSAGYYDQYYGKASRVRQLIKQDFDEAFAEVDLILTPTSPTPAFKIGEKNDDPMTMYLSDIYTVAVNLAGLPAASFPIGKIESLPVGMQLIGPAWSEGGILQLVKYLSEGGS